MHFGSNKLDPQNFEGDEIGNLKSLIRKNPIEIASGWTFNNCLLGVNAIPFGDQEAKAMKW